MGSSLRSLFTFIVVLLVATPFATALIPADAPVAAPVIFLGDTGFALSPIVDGGSGTATDPYIIQGRTFIVPSTPVGIASNDRPAAITFEGTTAHVVLRDNAFVGEPDGHFFAPGKGISLLNASNITIERNSFERFTSQNPAAAIHVASSADIRIVANEMMEGVTEALSLSGARIDVRDNRIHGAVRLLVAQDGTFARNEVDGSTSVRDGWRVENNSLSGQFALVIRGAAPTTHVVSNDLGGDLCLWVEGHDAVLRENRFDHCETPIDYAWFYQIDLDASNTVRGLPILDVHDVPLLHLADTGIGWLRVQRVPEVVLRNVSVGPSLADGWLSSLYGRDIASLDVESSTMVGIDVRSTDVTIRNSTVGALHLSTTERVRLGSVHAVSETFHSIGMAGTLEIADSRLEAADTALVLSQARGCATLRFERSQFVAPQALFLRSPGCLNATTPASSFEGTVDVSESHWSLTLDARDAWWGQTTGPEPGQIFSQGATVLYDPWLTSPPS